MSSAKFVANLAAKAKDKAVAAQEEKRKDEVAESGRRPSAAAS